jgi:hypothetical protein
MRTDEAGVADAVTRFVARLTNRHAEELPSPAAAGGEWLGVLRQWLARQSCGLVAVDNPGEFSWPGQWIGIVTAEAQNDPVAVLLFGTPSAVIASPEAPELMGRGVEELRFEQAFVLAPFDPFTPSSADRGRASGSVLGIYIADAKEGAMRPVTAAAAIRGRGLAGDRYAAGAGTFTPHSSRLRGYDITLIESEVLDAVTLADGSRLAPAESRRNVLSAGIDLNSLVGREFRIGAVRAFGQRLCEPCVHLQRLTRPGVVAALAHRGGLRADLLCDGEIRIGDAIEPA